MKGENPVPYFMFLELEWLTMKGRHLTDGDISRIIFYKKNHKERRGKDIVTIHDLIGS